MSMIHEITASAPKYKATKRKGRGESSGHGKTSGRGNKGSKARVGKYVKRGHEHGQTPIYRRLPKRGFSNFDFERDFHVVNLGELNAFDAGTVVDAAALVEKGLVPDLKSPVKILGDGELSRKLTIVAAKYSKSALDKIAGAGGVANNLKGEAFVLPKLKKKFVPREAVKKSKGESAKAEAAEAPAAETPKA